MSDITTDLDAQQKQEIRRALVESARKLLGATYEYGAEWVNYNIIPSSIDCSELVEGVYALQKLKMPDGSQNQFNYTMPVASPQIGDLAFFGRSGRTNEIYHVGMVFDKTMIIEARAHQPKLKESGKVILRPIWNWMNYKNFAGFKSHPKLI